MDQISNQLLLVFPDANKEQGGTAGGEAVAEGQDHAQMEQATVDEGVDEGEQQLQDNPLDVAEVDVHDKDEEQEEDEDEEEEEYDPEEDEYLWNLWNKYSQVGISLGGPTGLPWTKQVKICFTCISFYRCLRRSTDHSRVLQQNAIMPKWMTQMKRTLENDKVSFSSRWVMVTL